MKVNNFINFNNKHKTKLIYHLGVDSGFFSEYNNMVFAMVYCLEHNIRFELYSSNANFGKRGWNEFFSPFIDEHTSRFNQRINKRYLDLNISKTKKAVKKLEEYLVRKLYFRQDEPFYFTHELWPNIKTDRSNNEIITINNLGFQGTFLDLCSWFTNFIWEYNGETRKEIIEYQSKLQIPSPYLGFHIRGGDKTNEHQLIPPSKYLKTAESKSDIRTAFVLTDDYRIIEQLESDFPNWEFHTLCNESERGYYHNSFTKSNEQFKREQHIKLFASVELLTQSELFFGGVTSNVGVFLGMRIPKEKFISLDFPEWRKEVPLTK